MLGPERGDVSSGLRVHRVERHLIYYRASSEELEIARVLHVRRDIEAELA